MNVYDEAYSLKRAIKESQEYKQYMAIKEEVAQNEKLDKMLKDFQKQQFAIQTKQMTGVPVTEDMQKQFQDLYTIIMQDPKAAQFIQCEMRFSMMMNDVYKILGEAILTEKEIREEQEKERKASEAAAAAAKEAAKKAEEEAAAKQTEDKVPETEKKAETAEDGEKAGN
ncbi:MAG: YlbF family regulator [Firmicutes bacterium]|nr:YlbF family regulator [Bacillota bacterium]